MKERHKPAQRATACSPGRVREPWEAMQQGFKPAQRATVAEVRRDHIPSEVVVSKSFREGVRVESVAVACCAGFDRCDWTHPGLADSPWARCCRPLGGLVFSC